jgi:threonine aldolase
MAAALAEIAAGFDSVYVSLYKGIGGLGGAMLLRQRAFVARAAEWFRARAAM